MFPFINSISMVYTNTAFDEYDIICCVGDYHIREFKSLKNKKNFESKIFLKTGYFYFDYIEQNCFSKCSPYIVQNLFLICI